MKNIPQKIYLVIDEAVPQEEDFKELDAEYVYWCEDRQNDTDIEYVLADKEKATSIDFAEWISLNNWEEYSTKGEWIHPDRTVCSSEELFKKFKNKDV